MHGEGQDVLLGGEGEQGCAQHEVLAQVEGAADLVQHLLADQGIALGRVARQVQGEGAQLHARVGEDVLPPLAIVEYEAGAQGFVAPEDVVQAALQGRDVQAAAQAQGDGDVVGGRAGVELLDEQQPLLSVGQAQVLFPAWPGFDWRQAFGFYAVLYLLDRGRAQRPGGFVPQFSGQTPGDPAQAVRDLGLTPGLGQLRLDGPALEEVGIADGARLRAHAIGHPLPFIGVEQGRIEVDAQEVADLPGGRLRVPHQVLVAHQHVPLGIDRFEEVQGVAGDPGPHVLGQLGGVHARAGEDLLHAVAHKGFDHGVGVAHQVDVFGVFEQRFGPLQHLDIQAVGGGFVDQDARLGQLLQDGVHILHRQVRRLPFLNQGLRRLEIQALQFHQGALQAFVQVAAGERFFAGLHAREGQQVQLGRAEDPRMPGEHHPQEGRSGARG